MSTLVTRFVTVQVWTSFVWSRCIARNSTAEADRCRGEVPQDALPRAIPDDTPIITPENVPGGFRVNPKLEWNKLTN